MLHFAYQTLIKARLSPLSSRPERSVVEGSAVLRTRSGNVFRQGVAQRRDLLSWRSTNRRSIHLSRRVFAKPENLFQVMLPMHQMKLSPLRRVQWAQNRMIE
jgi:hypothetical protein